MLKKIVVDAFGGDNAPLEIIKACVRAVNTFNDVLIILTGDENKITEILKNYEYDNTRIEIINAPDIISNDDVPTVAIKTKTNSSLVVAFDTLKREDVIGMVSAGSTGAVLTGGFLKIGRIKGVSRPALAPTLPTFKGTPVLLIDCGANADAKPINLCHFAVMGSEYMKAIYGNKNAKVALLSNGVEDHKGNDLVKKTFPYLKELPINFVGNMEAREFMSGDYDVVVSDGFSGNVLLKSSEGAVGLVMKSLKREIQSSFSSKIGALFMRKSFKKLKKTFDYSLYGGSPFLGMKKLIIKSHGSSKEESIFQSIKQVCILNEAHLIESIENTLSTSLIDIKE